MSLPQENPRDVAAAAESETRALVNELRTALAIRYRPAPVPRPRVDTTERAIGGHGDPTADLVLDERREAVSDVVVRAERLLAFIAERVSDTRRELRAAVAAWEGDSQ